MSPEIAKALGAVVAALAAVLASLQGTPSSGDTSTPTSVVGAPPAATASCAPGSVPSEAPASPTESAPASEPAEEGTDSGTSDSDSKPDEGASEEGTESTSEKPTNDDTSGQEDGGEGGAEESGTAESENNNDSKNDDSGSDDGKANEDGKAKEDGESEGSGTESEPTAPAPTTPATTPTAGTGSTPENCPPAAPTTTAPTSETPATTTPVAAAPAAPAGDGKCVPAQVLDLKNWSITLPIGNKGDPDSVFQPKLATFSHKDYFSAAPDCKSVTFRAPVTGVTTPNSKNPRSELREMNGEEEAAWSSTAGTHTMTVTQAFVRLPTGKPHLVGAQIHGGGDDVTVFRLEGKNLYTTDGDNTHGNLIDNNYVLGTKIETKFVVSGGKIQAFYNGKLVTTLNKELDGAYFKTGAYTQANCGNIPANDCNANNYGETRIYSIAVSHT